VRAFHERNFGATTRRVFAAEIYAEGTDPAVALKGDDPVFGVKEADVVSFNGLDAWLAKQAPREFAFMHAGKKEA
jgi:hypothetical protein